MKQLTILCSILATILLFTQCAQLSSFQTAKVVGKNNGEIGFAAGGAGFSGIIDELDESETPILPIFELWGRYGVGNKVDLGLKLSTGLSGVFDAKFQLVGDRQSTFAMALGGGIGFQGGTLESALLQGHIPLHMSIHPSEKVGIFLTPRYISQFIIGDGSINYAGASTGIEIGTRIKFIADFSYFGLLNDTGDIDDGLFGDFGTGLFQGGIGMKFLIGDN